MSPMVLSTIQIVPTLLPALCLKVGLGNSVAAWGPKLQRLSSDLRKGSIRSDGHAR